MAASSWFWDLLHIEGKHEKHGANTKLNLQASREQSFEIIILKYRIDALEIYWFDIMGLLLHKHNI